MPERDDSLEALRAHSDAIADGDGRNGSHWAAHAAVLDRLAAMRRRAEAAGWTSIAIERDGAAERFRLFGIPPGAALRVEVPGSFDDQPPDTMR